MGPTIFACTLVFLAGVSAVYGYPAAVQEEWPHECRGKYYCWVPNNQTYPYQDFERLLKGVNITTEPVGSIIDRIGPMDKDIGDCQSRPLLKPIYMIKDSDNVIWYVPLKFHGLFPIEECRTPGLKKSSNLDTKKSRGKVHCWEQRVDFKYPVLSKDRTKLETRSPYKGIPMGCSAKIIQRGQP